MKKIITRTLMASMLAAPIAITPISSAQAYAPSCTNTKVRTVSNINFTKLNTSRRCSTLRNNREISGEAQLTKNYILVRSGNKVPASYVNKVTLHEMAHTVEWRTTNKDRQAMYSYLGVRTNGNYFSIPTASGSNLKAWKGSARERLAESVVKCQTGQSLHSGMNLVPRSKCAAFMQSFRAGLAHAK